jgi:hypothetical protein
MKSTRRYLLAAAALLSLVLAYMAREFVHELIVAPMVYAVWQVSVLLGTVPEPVRWTALIAILGLVVAWQLVPEVRPASRAPGPRSGAAGQVEVVATWLLKARSSNYFKWQLAHRLARVARGWDELRGQPAEGGISDRTAEDFLSAGSQHSFVDFPAPHGFFGGHIDTPLDVDPEHVVLYLERRTSADGENHGRSL